MDSINHFIHPLCQVIRTGHAINDMVSIHLVQPTTCTTKYVYIYIFINPLLHVLAVDHRLQGATPIIKTKLILRSIEW